MDQGEQLSQLAVTHLLQHTLRSLCIHENSQWVYAVFWRILPRNYPPPKWEGHGAYDRSRGNRRNWILVWEDGFCNFGASTTTTTRTGLETGGKSVGSVNNNNNNNNNSISTSMYGNYSSSSPSSSSCDDHNNNNNNNNQEHHYFQQFQGLQPDLFFKMSHEIYNYGEGLIGKVAADHSHKWIYKEPNDQEINFLSAWHNSADSYPRTWEAQFQSGIKTIALIAVREGVVQLGSIHKVIEDLSYVVLLRKKLSYIESIPGVLLPHPSSPSSSSSSPYNHNYGITPDNNNNNAWPNNNNNYNLLPQSTHHQSYYDHHHHHSYYNQLPLMKNNNNNNNMITPSMSSLEALLSKLPSVVPPPAPPHMAAHTAGCFSNDLLQRSTNLEFVAKNEVDHDDNNNNNNNNNDQDQQQYHFHHHNNLYSQK
ncbi:hypothetical protein CsatB_022151 [Cannabis sativa]